jgi:hypothetical protein
MNDHHYAEHSVYVTQADFGRTVYDSGRFGLSHLP